MKWTFPQPTSLFINNLIAISVAQVWILTCWCLGSTSPPMCVFCLTCLPRGSMFQSRWPPTSVSSTIRPSAPSVLPPLVQKNPQPPNKPLTLFLLHLKCNITSLDVLQYRLQLLKAHQNTSYQLRHSIPNRRLLRHQQTCIILHKPPLRRINLIQLLASQTPH